MWVILLALCVSSYCSADKEVTVTTNLGDVTGVVEGFGKRSIQKFLGESFLNLKKINFFSGAI